MPLSEQNRAAIRITMINPHVGGLSNANMLVVEERASTVACRQSWWVSLFFIIGWVMFGPVMLWMAVTHPEDIQDIPIVIGCAVIVLLLLANVGLLAAIFKQPKIIIDKASGTLRLYANFKSEAKLVFRPDEMEQVLLSEHRYTSKSRTYPNYMLTLSLKSGKTHQLCCSTDKDQIERFASFLTTYSRIPLVREEREG